MPGKRVHRGQSAVLNHDPHISTAPMQSSIPYSEALDKSDGVTVAAQQLSLLEAKLVSRNREGHGAVKGTVKTNGDGASVQERLAILLQVGLYSLVELTRISAMEENYGCKYMS